MNLNKKIIDKVYLKEKKIDYSYGSLKFQKNNKKGKFFKFLQRKYWRGKKIIIEKIKSLLFKIDNQNVFRF